MKNAETILSEALEPFKKLSEEALLAIITAAEEGRKVGGIYCAFAPEELLRAADAVPVTLCGKSEKPIPAAESVLPPSLCPLIKSSYGFALTDTCPYFAASDFIIGETTCDGKKKMFELMGRLKPVHVMQLPYASDNLSAQVFWESEVLRLKGYIEDKTGTEITDDVLSQQIDLCNERRRLLKEMVYKCARAPFPISGSDMLLMTESRNFAVDLPRYNRLLGDFLKKLDAVASAGGVIENTPPKILITGCPMGRGTDKVLNLVEESGGFVACQEHCSGLKSFDRMVDTSIPPIEALSLHYLNTPCSCMTPNSGRFSLLSRLIKDFQIDAVVDVTLQNCHTYNVEAKLVEELSEDKIGIPCLHLETGYSPSDTEQLRVRIEAFLEML